MSLVMVGDQFFLFLAETLQISCSHGSPRADSQRVLVLWHPGWVTRY